MNLVRTSLLSNLFAILFATFSFAGLTVDEGFNMKLNCIRDATNPSDGVCFLDMSYSVGLDLPAALTAAQADYPTARLATPTEWDHMLLAAGISYDGTTLASDAFVRGFTETISSGGNYDGGVLATALGATSTGQSILDDVFIWSDPDGDLASFTTRDTLFLGGPVGTVSAQVQQLNSQAPQPTIGYLLVRPTAVPEPSSCCLLGLIGIGLGLRKWLSRRVDWTPTWGEF